MENITLSDEDLGLAFETYISICRDDSNEMINTKDYFLDLMNKKNPACFDPMPTINEGDITQGQQPVYYFDGQRCKAMFSLPGLKTKNQFLSSSLCEMMCVPRCQ